MKKEIITEVKLTKGNVTLGINVSEDLKLCKNEKAENCGYIQVTDGYIDSKEVFWDNINWFLHIDDEKKKEIVEELKEKGQHYKGVIKDIKSVVKRALKLNLLYTIQFNRA